MTQRQGNVSVATIVSVKIGAIVTLPILAVWLNQPALMFLWWIAIIF